MTSYIRVKETKWYAKVRVDKKLTIHKAILKSIKTLIFVNSWGQKGGDALRLIIS